MLPTIGTRRISHPNQKGERGGGITSSRINNLPVRALQPHLATPSECLVPHFREKQIIHRPTLLQQTSTGSIVVEGNDKEKDATLDGFVLLESTGLALPDDVIYIILTSKRFTKVIENDLVFFTGLLHLDLSENFLDLAPFGCLPNLKELRLACNAIREIYMDDLDADSFPALMLLDLSYNSLTTNSVLALSRIPLLKELDISGNKLTEMPTSMSEFKCLEKLVLENNKFDDIKVFNQLATAPNLRDCFLAYNFLWKFPTTKGFKMLETLDVAFNYFGAEENVEGVLSLSRLRSLVLYGNPLLGPTGEDPHFIYIEDLAEAAWSAAYGPSNDNSNNNNENSAGADGNRLRRTPIEIVTEIPRKRTYIKGQDLGRRLITYRDFTMAVPERSAMEKVGGKLARDWIKEGNNTLFAQAVALAQLQQQEQMGGGKTHTRPRASNSPEGYDELTFLTRPPGEPDPYGDDEEEEERGTLGLLSRDKGVHSNNNNNNNKNAAGGSKSNIADGIVSFSKPNNNHGGGHGGMSMANAVMGRVAEELGLSQQSTGATRVTRAAVNGHEQVLPNISSDLLELRARAGIKSTYVSQHFSCCCVDFMRHPNITTPTNSIFLVLFVSNRPASRALSSSLTMGPGIEDADNIEPGVGEDDVAAVTSQQRQPPHQQQAASVPDFLLRRSMVSQFLIVMIIIILSYIT